MQTFTNWGGHLGFHRKKTFTRHLLLCMGVTTCENKNFAKKTFTDNPKTVIHTHFSCLKFSNDASHEGRHHSDMLLHFACSYGNAHCYKSICYLDVHAHVWWCYMPMYGGVTCPCMVVLHAHVTPSCMGM